MKTKIKYGWLLCLLVFSACNSWIDITPSDRLNADYVQTIINITQTTSASYLLLTSLDISRRNLALRGRQSFEKVSEWAQYAREEINSIGGYYAYGKE